MRSTIATRPLHFFLPADREISSFRARASLVFAMSRFSFRVYRFYVSFSTVGPRGVRLDERRENPVELRLHLGVGQRGDRAWKVSRSEMLTLPSGTPLALVAIRRIPRSRASVLVAGPPEMVPRMISAGKGQHRTTIERSRTTERMPRKAGGRCRRRARPCFWRRRRDRFSATNTASLLRRGRARRRWRAFTRADDAEAACPPERDRKRSGPRQRDREWGRGLFRTRAAGPSAEPSRSIMPLASEEVGPRGAPPPFQCSVTRAGQREGANRGASHRAGVKRVPISEEARHRGGRGDGCARRRRRGPGKEQAGAGVVGISRTAGVRDGPRARRRPARRSAGRFGFDGSRTSRLPRARPAVSTPPGPCLSARDAAGRAGGAGCVHDRKRPPRVDSNPVVASDLFDEIDFGAPDRRGTSARRTSQPSGAGAGLTARPRLGRMRDDRPARRARLTPRKRREAAARRRRWSVTGPRGAGYSDRRLVLRTLPAAYGLHQRNGAPQRDDRAVDVGGRVRTRGGRLGLQAEPGLLVFSHGAGLEVRAFSKTIDFVEPDTSEAAPPINAGDGPARAESAIGNY